MDGGGAEGETGVARYGIDVWVRPPRSRIQANVGATAAHEGGTKSRSRHGGHRYLGGAQALPTRKGPYRWKLSLIGKAVAVHAEAVEPVLATPAREDPREGVKGGPPTTGAGEATGTAEVGRMGLVGGEHPRRGLEPRTRGECGPLKRRHGRSVCVPSPGYAVGPKAHRSARGASRVDAPGSGEYGYS